MLTPEKNYDFRKDLMQVHKSNRRDMSLVPKANEVSLADGICIVLPDNANAVITTAANDFADYMNVSMNTGAMVSPNAVDGCFPIILAINTDIEDASGYMGYRITTKADGVLVEGWHDKGIAQALYALEDIMNIRKAPYLEIGVIKRRAVFERRFTQSPLGFMAYTDEMLSLIAHYGMDCISVWAMDMEKDRFGAHYDLPLLCDRAEKYGIDVYLESYIHHSKHPDDPGAYEYYDELYGKMFSKCPKLKGISLSGEAARFYSHDPHALTPEERAVKDGIPKTKPNPGWWPCYDYPAWIEVIKKAIFKHRPDADIIFGSYNWGYVDEKYRIELIENLPDGISFCPSWDIFGRVNIGDVKEQVSDYSLSYTGPSEYFKSEAIAAKKKNVRLYVNGQMSGRTWDFGVVPYEPMPYQWIKRYENLIKANKEWGLCGVNENIHYGFHPSFITDLEKQMFFTNGKEPAEILRDILIRDYGEDNFETIDKAMHIWSDAITHYVATNEDQYGAFRVGPSYPLWTYDNWYVPNDHNGIYPPCDYAVHKGIFYSTYRPDYHKDYMSLHGIRMQAHFKEFAILRDMLLDGINVLETIKNRNDALQRLINLGWFMYRTTLTVLNVKQHFILKTKLDIASTREEAKELIDGIEEILLNEKANVEATIPLVQVDSRLGWEPSMEYTTDENGLRWKLRQLDYELNERIALFRKQLAN